MRGLGCRARKRPRLELAMCRPHCVYLYGSYVRIWIRGICRAYYVRKISPPTAASRGLHPRELQQRGAPHGAGAGLPHRHAPMALRVGFVLLVVAGSEALTSSRVFRPKLPDTRPVVASLEAAANLEAANLETAPRRQRAPNLKRVELVASTDTAEIPWLGRLNKVSNVASILCAIDCTVFPVLLTLLPILNMGSSGKYEVRRHAPIHPYSHPNANGRNPKRRRQTPGGKCRRQPPGIGR